MEGTVSNFLPSKGYGFLRGDDGRDYFAHHSDLVESQAAIEGQRVTFEESATPKGYRARRIRPVALRGSARYVLPHDVLTSRGDTINEWEVVERCHWMAGGSSRDSPEDAMHCLRKHAKSIGATGVLCVAYSKTRGEEPGSGHGAHFFAIHNYQGRPVVLGRPSVQGTHLLSTLMGLDERAAAHKEKLVAMTAQSRSMALATVVGIVAIAASTALIGAGVAVFILLAAIILCANLWPTLAKDHDGWLIKNETDR